MDDAEKAAQIISCMSDDPVLILTDGHGQTRLTTNYEDADNWEREGFDFIAMYEKGVKL